jgi:hypothetical protein
VSTANPYKTTRRRSSISESNCAEELGGRVQPNSGATPFSSKKADVRTSLFAIDDKVTANDSYRLTVTDWRKITSQAFRQQRKPAMRVNFEKHGVAVYIIPAETMKEYHELKEGNS